MDKETIRFALRSLLRTMETRYGYDGVWVPKWADSKPCGWRGRDFNGQKIPFQVMLDVMDFSLDFAMIRMPNGQILRQAAGIPMGDPLSHKPANQVVAGLLAHAGVLCGELRGRASS